jgi:TetR/AcrR family transcriptional regulator, regulator of cefoperazone and chloramphenicol sensitivity
MKAKEKIIIAAEEIFANYHYEHATIKMICDLAEVNIASVNYHFRSKKELYLEVMDLLNSKAKYKIAGILEYKTENVSQDEWESFITTLAITYTSKSDDPNVKKWYKIIFREFNNPSEVFDDIYELYILPVLKHTKNNIKCFFPEMDDNEITRWFVSLISQIGFAHSAKSLVSKYCGLEFYDKDNLEEYARHISRNIYTLLKVSDKE